MSFVYVTSYEDGIYKIGSAKSVKKRIASLQTSHHQRLRLDAAYDSPRHAECDVSIIGAKPSMLLPEIKPFHLSGDSFSEWAKEMRRLTGLSDSVIAAHLGIDEHVFEVFKSNGADRTTALTCRALLHRMEPYGS